MGTIEKINSALSALNNLRSNVRQHFEFISRGVGDTESEEERTQFVNAFQDNHNAIVNQLREFETLVNNLQAPQGPFFLGNTIYLEQETAPDRQILYSQLVNSYKWIDKVHEYSFVAFNSLNQNNLRRSYTYGTQKRGFKPSNWNNTDPEYTEKLFNEILQHTTPYKIFRPFGTNVVIIVSISRVLKAAIVCKGVLIEWVTVKGFDEALDPEDLWVESRYEVFRKVQEHTHSAMLHFFSPTLPDLALKSYMTWLNSYSKLFLEPCKRCMTHLLNGLPPTWRDFRTLEPYHVECRNF